MKRQIDLYGVPMDLGAARRGVDMGPSALRIAGVVERVTRLGHEIADHGNLDVPGMERAQIGDSHSKYQKAILDACGRLADAVEESVSNDRFPLVLGGDHSIALGTVTGIARVLRRKQQKLGLIWFDAHGDMNTPETSPSGNIHGMPLAQLLGFGSDEAKAFGGFSPKVEPQNTALIGIRSLDRWERDLMKKVGVHVFTMKEVDRLGMARVVEQAIEVVSRDTAGFHLSFDLDGLDPSVAPGTGTPVAGGIAYREAHLMMELIADTRMLLGLEVVELNPVYDHRNQTAEVGVAMIQSALGLRIL